MSDTQDNTILYTIHSPLTGTVCPLEDVPDPAFARKMIGDGMAIEPTDPFVYAPEDGTVISVFETKHAIVFETAEGGRMLLHIGVGTMRLHGEGFTALVDNGEKVKRGEKLMNIDLDYIRSHAPSLVSPVVVTGLEKGQRVRQIKEGAVSAGDAIAVVVADETKQR